MQYFKSLVVVATLLFAVVTAQAQPVGATNETAGLKLPAPFAVKSGEQFVDILAECKGPVKWLVLSSTEKIKYKVNPHDPLELTIGVPNNACTVTVYCIGVVDGKLTSYVRTDITVESGAGPPRPPQPQPPQPAAQGVRHVTIIEDASQRTQETAAIIESPTIGQKLTPPNYLLKVLSAKSPLVPAKGIDKVIAKAEQTYGKQPAWVLVQDAAGVPLICAPLPKTEDELVDVVKNAR